METICQPAAARCRMTSGLNGPEITSRIRSKYAIASLRIWFLQPETHAIPLPKSQPIACGSKDAPSKR
jgi:hypothetical protein